MTLRWDDRFPARFGLSEPGARRGVRTLYRFALEAEAASVAGESKRLEAWRAWLAEGGVADAPERTLAEVFKSTRAAGLAPAGLEDVAAAWHVDSARRRIATLEELEDHARNTSGAVGRLAFQLSGLGDEETLALAETLWTAVALTSIIQETKAFIEAGRVYLPADLMGEHGYAEADLRMGVVNDRFRGVMKDLWKRVRALYEESRPLPSRLRWPLSAEVRYGWGRGAALLARISRGGFDVLHGRPALSRWEALRLAAWAIVPL